MVKRRTYDDSHNVFESWLGLDANQHITADTVIDSYTHQIKSYTLFTYDSSDNIIQTKVYNPGSSGSFVHVTTNDYTYDQHPNPLYTIKYASGNSVLAPSYTYFGKNNLLTHTHIDHITGQSGMLREFSYEYNSLGLPVKRSSIAYQYTVSYEYKN